MITETDEVAAAIDLAAQRWPADRRSRSKLLLHLIDEGYNAIQGSQERRKAQWRAILDSTSGTFDYGPNYLEELRKEWPE
jgi:hypothetical protein